MLLIAQDGLSGSESTIVSTSKATLSESSGIEQKPGHDTALRPDAAQEVLAEEQNLVAINLNRNAAIIQIAKLVGLPSQLIGYVDDTVKAHLPVGTKIVPIRPHGTSQWSLTAKIRTIFNGDPVSYLLKVTTNKVGPKIFSSEFAGAKAIRAINRDLCPEPVGWGRYKSVPQAWFFLAKFREMRDELPVARDMGRTLAEFHGKAIAPDGRHGFDVQTVGGVVPLHVEKTTSWEVFLTNYMRHLLVAEHRSQGPASDDLERLTTVLFSRIIPRLCRPLETGGRSIKPTLLHSDLWDGNIAVNAQTGRPVIFDPSCFYGHNEFDLGPWRCERHATGKEYIDAYFACCPPSAPEEDWEGRNLLYLL
jgi:protein-ribulosamine 3-kinase